MLAHRDIQRNHDFTPINALPIRRQGAERNRAPRLRAQREVHPTKGTTFSFAPQMSGDSQRVPAPNLLMTEFENHLAGRSIDALSPLESGGAIVAGSDMESKSGARRVASPVVCPSAPGPSVAESDGLEVGDELLAPGSELGDGGR